MAAYNKILQVAECTPEYSANHQRLFHGYKASLWHRDRPSWIFDNWRCTSRIGAGSTTLERVVWPLLPIKLPWQVAHVDCANGIAIMVVEKHLEGVVWAYETPIRLIKKWMVLHGVEFAGEKTVAVLVNSRKLKEEEAYDRVQSFHQIPRCYAASSIKLQEALELRGRESRESCSCVKCPIMEDSNHRGDCC